MEVNLKTLSFDVDDWMIYLFVISLHGNVLFAMCIVCYLWCI